MTEWRQPKEEAIHWIHSLFRLRMRSAARPVDFASLAVFRILFGLAMAVAMVRALVSGWAEEVLVRPDFFFKYAGFAWVPVPSGPVLQALLAGLAACALCIAVGLFYRPAAVLFLVGFSWVQLMDLTNYLNHYYLVSLLALLLTFLPLHRAVSVDAWWRPSLTLARFPAWWSWLLRAQVGIVYFFAALAKATPDWLGHGQPMGIWLASRGDVPLIGPLLILPGVALAMSWGGFLYDLTIPLWLLHPRTRRVAYIAVIGFHSMVGLLFPIGMFPWIMIIATTVFFAPEWPRAWLRGWRLANEASAGKATSGFRLGTMSVLAALYLVVQVLVPLRAFAYGGNVLWHEQGMRFSWRVMSREKNGSVTYRVRARGWTRERLVSPSDYLTAIQERELVTQPDLILALAHHVAEDLRARGLSDVEVRVDALASLNGRPMTPLIDPDVDLTTVEDSFAPADWILPAPDGVPPSLSPRSIEAVAEVSP